MSETSPFHSFTFSHENVSRTSISAGGRLLYVIDTPRRKVPNPLARPPPTTIRHPAGILEGTNTLVEGETVAVIDWHKWAGNSKVVYKGDASTIKSFMPLKGWRGSSRVMKINELGDCKWSRTGVLANNLQLTDPSRRVIAQFHRAEGGQKPHLEVNPIALPLLDHILIGLVVIHHDIKHPG